MTLQSGDPKPDNVIVTYQMNKVMVGRFLAVSLLLWSALMACSRVAAATCDPRVTLTVRAHAPSWVRMRVDGARNSYTGIMRPGQIVERSGRRIIVIETGNAGGITVKLNGRKLAPLGRSGQPVVRRYTPPPVPVAMPLPVVPPPAPKPVLKPVVLAQPLPKPTITSRVPATPSRPMEQALPAHTSLYVSLALLVIPFFVFIWMLVAMRREGRLLASLGIAGADRSIKVVASQRLSRGRTVYLLEAAGHLFLVATGGAVLFSEVESPEQGAKHD